MNEPAPVATANLTGEQVKGLTGITDEQIKYLKCWNVDQYRDHSPGEQLVDMFLEAVDFEEGDTLADWGCGTGRASLKLAAHGFKVTAMDFAGNCLDKEVQEVLDDPPKGLRMRFLEHDITKKIDHRTKFGFCCDVMEHLPPEEVDLALDVILENSQHVFFQICTTSDHFGLHPEIGHPLHLSVHGYQWWLKKFVEHGIQIHRSMEKPGHVIFLVSGFTGFSFDKLQHNTAIERVNSNVRANYEFGCLDIVPHEQNDMKVIMLGGGPSLNDFTDEIIEKRSQLDENGEHVYKLVTTNGTYNWALEHGLIPSSQLIIDARPFNKRFVEPVVDDCKYIIATQCDPTIFEGLPPDRTYYWQVTLNEETAEVVKEVWGVMHEKWHPCAGGSTVMMRGLPLLQMLGFRDIEIYGFDSCCRDDEHHAYEQAENDKTHNALTIPIGIADRTFRCQPWMLAQAKEFIECRHNLLRYLDIKVHGDGLIAYLLETGADVIEE